MAATLYDTYPFGTGGLDVSSATQTGDSIRLTCGTAGFPLPSSTAWEQEKSSLFAVIQPGTHKLRIRYTIKPSAGASFTIVKEIGEREYRVNGVTTIKHKLEYGEFDFTFENSYYMWDAKKWFWDGVGNYPAENGQTAPNPPPNRIPTAGTTLLPAMAPTMLPIPLKICPATTL